MDEKLLVVEHEVKRPDLWAQRPPARPRTERAVKGLIIADLLRFYDEAVCIGSERDVVGDPLYTHT